MEVSIPQTARRRWLTCAAIGATVFLVCAVLLVLDTFEPLEMASSHLRFWLRGENDLHPDVALLGITPNDIKWSQESMPWPRTYYAVMVQTLSFHGAKAVGLDLYFPKPSLPDEDAAFAQAVAESPNTVTGFYFDLARGALLAEPENSPALKELALRAAGPADAELMRGALPHWPIPALRLPGQVGFLNVSLERGTVVHLPLVISYRGYLFPSLVLAMVCRYYGVNLSDVVVTPGHHVALTPPNGDAVRIPIDSRGRLIVNYSAGHEAMKRYTISFMRALQAQQQLSNGETPDLDLAAIKGKAVLIADLSSTDDVHTTPLGETFGVSVHINALSSILSGDTIHPPDRRLTLALLALSSCAFVCIGTQRSFRRSLLAAVITLVVYLGLVWFTFVRTLIWIDVVAPTANMVLLYMAIVTYRYFAEERAKARMRAMFVRYLSPDAVEQVLQTPEHLLLEGQLKTVTVLLSDIRDFTTITEELGAQETVAMLNDYFAPMVTIVLDNGGMINQFVGDEILAVWGAPTERPDDALNAVKAALKMRDELATLMESREALGLKTFAIGIGINTGETKVGNIGTRDHIDYAVIGDTINYAARLEALTKEHLSPDCPAPILISQATYERVKNRVDVTPIGEIQVKGKKQVSMIYKLNGLREGAPDQGQTAG